MKAWLAVLALVMGSTLVFAAEERTLLMQYLQCPNDVTLYIRSVDVNGDERTREFVYIGRVFGNGNHAKPLIKVDIANQEVIFTMPDGSVKIVPIDLADKLYPACEFFADKV